MGRESRVTKVVEEESKGSSPSYIDKGLLPLDRGTGFSTFYGRRGLNLYGGGRGILSSSGNSLTIVKPRAPSPY